jgi:Chaperone of endosialidase
MATPALQKYQDGLGSVSADGLNTFIQNGQYVSALRSFTGLTNMAVQVIGTTTPNDGGQGLFYYDPNSTAPDDGISVIVPYGNTQGAWIRLVFVAPTIVATSVTTPIVNSTTSLSLETGGAAVIVIDNAQRVGISSPVGSNWRWGQRGFGTTSASFCGVWQNATGSTDIFWLRDDGAVFMPQTYSITSASAANMYIASDGSIYRSTSSLRYKVNVTGYTHGIDKLMELRPVSYQSKSDEAGPNYAGFIAEEVDALGLKEFVVYDDQNQPDALQYPNMLALVVKAMQELKSDFEAYKAAHP